MNSKKLFLKGALFERFWEYGNAISWVTLASNDYKYADDLGVPLLADMCGLASERANFFRNCLLMVLFC